jgi:hypothetical protein
MVAIDVARGAKISRDLRRLADRNDLAAIHRNSAVANDAAVGIDGDQPIDIRDNKVDTLHGVFQKIVIAAERGNARAGRIPVRVAPALTFIARGGATNPAVCEFR